MTKAARDRSDYFRTYYEENREELSDKRRDRYQSDPEYRERAKEAARVYRAKKKAERDRLIAEGKIEPASRGGPRKPVEVQVNGRPALAYTITTVANEVGRSVDALNNWAKSGIFPITPLRSAGGDRLYTTAMILVLKDAILKRGTVSAKDESFCEEVLDGWRELGLDV